MRSKIDVVQVELGSAMYKEGFRWTEFMESDSFGKQDTKYMVLVDNILINHFCKICSAQCSTSRLAHLFRSRKQNTKHKKREEVGEQIS